MASERAMRIQEMKDRAQQNDRLDRLERMVEQLHAALVGKGGKTADEAPFEVPASELAETPVLVPVTAADDGKGGKSGKK